ncbi:DUF6686 family protein [Lacinutrix himadriensis]|uniref:DUF6686 family protein n=1 Tax=Lacinutrix himadriensis TaxID=641549 RepID=UPI0006E1FD6D|nr:DUF6686 family protein [Lacinutrix himadriensis]
MCSNIKTISKVTSGELSICTKCNVYHLEFNNIYFEFSEAQYKQFKKYLFAIDSEYWENKYGDAKVKRKIPVPSLQSNLVLMFNRQEIKELKSLFSNKKQIYNKYLNVDDIDYTLILN